MNPPCPVLPLVDEPLSASDIAALGPDRGPTFYLTSLRYAQSLWQMGLPGQAILQVNRAFSCVFDALEPVLQQQPLPYRVIAWMLQNHPKGQFIGNPRRHWQHLATRMVEPHKALRTWRAWACWYIAKSLLPSADYPSDLKQIRDEGIVEPTFHDISTRLRELSNMDDESAWLVALQAAGIEIPAVPAQINIEIIGAEQLPIVRTLAHRIWPQVYPSIISHEQIDYMLRQRYELAALIADIELKGGCYALIKADAQPLGYIHIEPRPAASDLFLHKLYLLPEAAGRGIGAAALRWVEAQARQHAAPAIRLTVNKHNTNAIRAYLRAGYTFEADIITDIGNGFVMDDYQMLRSLDPASA